MPTHTETPPTTKQVAAPWTGWCERLDRAAERAGHGIIHYDAAGGQRFQSYATLRDEAVLILGEWQRVGLKPGAGVVLQLEASDEFWAVLWACLMGGYTAIPVLRPPTYAHDSGGRRKLWSACAALPDTWVALRREDRADFEAAAKAEGLAPRIWEFGLSAPASPGVAVPSGPDRVALLLFTSGSTGAGKGVPLTEGNLAAMAEGTIAMNGFTAADVALNWMAGDHVGAIVFLGLVPLAAGCNQVQVPTSFILQRPTRWLDLIAEHRASISWAPNFAFALVLDREAEVRAGTWDLSSMRFLVNAGEPIVARTARRFLEVMESRGLPADALRPAFGMSETCSGITWSRGFRRSETTDAQQFVSLGPPIPGAEMRIVDEAGRPVPEGVSGRFLLRGPSVFSGYHQRPDLKAETFVDGWFVTGDLAYLKDGELYITGREKDVIIVNGANFYAHEIESVAEQIAGVRRSFTAASAVRDAQSETEQLAVFFVADAADGADAVTALAKAIRAAVAQQIGVTPHYVLALTADEVPKTEIGKIKRPALRQTFEAGELAGRVVLKPAPERKRGAGPVIPAAGPKLDRRTLQREIGRIWAEILGLERVGYDETFFELGGHSLLVVQVQEELKTLLGRDVTVAELFSHPTVNALAGHFSGGGDARGGASATASATRGAVSGGGVSGRSQGVAIIGIGCCFPGADGPAAFWKNLEEGKESIRFFTAEDALAAGVDPALVRDPSFVKAAPVIDGVEDFDAEFFKYSAKEARLIDPQQRLFLESCWEAFEDAGYDPLTTPHEVGLYAAAGLNTYLANNLLADTEFLAEETGGRMLTVDSMGGFNVMITNDKDYLTTRVAFKLNLRGPVVNLQSACSSTLLAVHQASRALIDGECSMALAGGVSIKLPQYAGHQYSPGMLNSPDGHCRAYDAAAEGTIFGNGSGVVLLKRVEDAVADGDAIYAVVRGSATNNDGGDKAGYTAPSAEGEYRVMRDAIARAGVHAETITYVEGHGTGTPLGDPIEIDALSRAFRDHTDRTQFCAVGSVKTNIGHMQIASGIAGLIKTALAVRHAQIPATLHYERPNPQINFEASPFFVSNRTIPWETGGMPRRAGVNSLGIGGSNVHVILEQAPAAAERDERADGPGPFLLPLSARHPKALAELAGRYADYLTQYPTVALDDVCHTARTGRARLAWRKAFVAADRADLIAQLRACADSASRPVESRPAAAVRLAFLYSGQGAQRPGMGRELAARFPVFRDALQACAAVADTLLPAPLLSVMWPEGEADAARLQETRFTQPVLFAYGHALAELYRSWGVEPDVGLGHSVGEYLAAVQAGIWTWEEALRLVIERGRLMHEAPGDGAMLAVMSSPEQLGDLPADIVIAGYNARAQTVLAGPTGSIENLATKLRAAGLLAKRLPVSHAFHSPLMASAEEAFAEIVRATPPRAPRLEVVSNVTGRIETTLLADPDYWPRHLREPVRYAAGVEHLLEQGLTTFLEIGPQPVLTAMSRRDHEDEKLTWIGSARREGHEVFTLLEAVAILFEHGAPVAWDAMAADLPGRRISGLPTYPWQRQRYWVEGSQITRRTAAVPAMLAAEPFLGRALRLPRSTQRVFELSATPAGMPWVADHVVHGRMVAPGAQWLGQCLSAGEKLFGGRGFALEELTFATPLVVSESQPREVQLVATPAEETNAWEAEIISFSGDGEDVVVHATVRFVAVDLNAVASLDVPRASAEMTETVNVAAHFETMAGMGIALGPAFRWIDAIRRDGRGRALLTLATPLTAGAPVGWHPGLLDCALQSLVAAMPAVEGSFVPFRLRGVKWHRSLPSVGPWWVKARWTPPAEGATSLRGDVTLYAHDGAPLCSVEGFELRAITAADVRRQARDDFADTRWHMTWEPLAATRGAAGRWLVLADGTTKLAGDLTGAIEAAGHAVQRAEDSTGVSLDEFSGVIDLRILNAGADDVMRRARQAALAWWAEDRTVPCVTLLDGGDPARAEAVAAFWRALRWERPEATGRTCVVSGTDWPQTLARELAALATTPAEISFRLEADGLRVARLQPQPAEPAEASRAVVRPEAVYLVTGGWGALGLVTAEYLIDAGARKLVLVGRSAPDAAAAARLATWRAAGVDVALVSGDLSEAEIARAAVAKAGELGPLRGVVHAAGVLRDGLLAAQTDESFDAVWQAKAGAAEALMDALGDAELDFCVFYSSIASAMGSAAQSNYAAANGYLDGLASARRASGRPAVSVRWGPWSDVGMTARLASSSRERLAAWGFGEIAPGTAKRMLGRLFVAENDPVVLPLDRTRFTTALGPNRPGLFRAMLTAPTSMMIAGTTPERDGLGAGLAALDEEARREKVTALVRETIARLLGLKHAAEVSVTQGLFDLGVDSLSAVDLKNRLQTALGLKIPATLVFDYPNVEAMAGFLNEKLAPAPRVETAPAVAPATVAEAATTIDEDDVEALLARELGE